LDDATRLCRNEEKQRKSNGRSNQFTEDGKALQGVRPRTRAFRHRFRFARGGDPCAHRRKWRGEIHVCKDRFRRLSAYVRMLHGPREEDCVRAAKDSEEAGIHTIHQEINLVPYFNAYQNIFIGNEKSNRFGWMKDKEMAKKAEEVLSRLNITLDVHKPVMYFNTSLQRIVQISSALIYEPEILIFDERPRRLARKNATVCCKSYETCGIRASALFLFPTTSRRSWRSPIARPSSRTASRSARWKKARSSRTGSSA
jgi:ABC-type dipeptide/oligopeptide/nickel transport system ATPase component